MTAATWNEIAPVGSLVHLTDSAGFVYSALTTTTARDLSSGMTVVGINYLVRLNMLDGAEKALPGGFVELSRLRLAHPGDESRDG